LGNSYTWSNQKKLKLKQVLITITNPNQMPIYQKQTIPIQKAMNKILPLLLSQINVHPQTPKNEQTCKNPIKCPISLKQQIEKL